MSQGSSLSCGIFIGKDKIQMNLKSIATQVFIGVLTFVMAEVVIRKLDL